MHPVLYRAESTPTHWSIAWAMLSEEASSELEAGAESGGSKFGPLVPPLGGRSKKGPNVWTAPNWLGLGAGFELTFVFAK